MSRGTLAGIVVLVMTRYHSRGPDVEERSAFIHQEILKLAILIALAIAGFFVTRAIAASNRSMTLRDAAEWYARAVSVPSVLGIQPSRSTHFGVPT